MWSSCGRIPLLILNISDWMYKLKFTMSQRGQRSCAAAKFKAQCRVWQEFWSCVTGVPGVMNRKSLSRQEKAFPHLPLAAPTCLMRRTRGRGHRHDAKQNEKTEGMKYCGRKSWQKTKWILISINLSFYYLKNKLFWLYCLFIILGVSNSNLCLSKGGDTSPSKHVEGPSKHQF